jgi:hypothetical protein
MNNEKEMRTELEHKLSLRAWGPSVLASWTR